MQVSAEVPAEIHGLATLIQLSGLVISALALVINYLSWRDKRRDDWTVDKLTAEVKEKLATRSVLDFEIISMEGYEHLTGDGTEPCVVKVRAKQDGKIYAVLVKRNKEALLIDLA